VWHPEIVLELREPGLYCPAGDFYIDPSLPVDRAIITHAHAGHAFPGSRTYLTAAPGEALLRACLGPNASIESISYGETTAMHDVSVSLHPAGHILGSAQIRLERRGEVWVVSGDYKLSPDPTCAAFEPLRCHTFVTESTFGLPIFRWPPESETVCAIHAWWRANQEVGKTSILFAHPLGKAQRVLSLLDPSIGPVCAHEDVERFNRIYRGQSVALPATPEPGGSSPCLILAPPSCQGTPWMKRWSEVSAAFVSGWMRIRGTRRRRSLDRGFVLSDHADWPALLQAIDQTGAETVWGTGGFRAPLVRWLEEQGKRAVAVDIPSPEAEL
jgi:putative mRNA 3-end processing factor